MEKPEGATAEKAGMSEIRNLVGRNLRSLRVSSGMKQLELAAKLGWVPEERDEKDNRVKKDNRSMVSQIERGHVGVSLETLWKIANIFQVPVADLLREDEEEHYPDPIYLQEIKQSELYEPEQSTSGLPPRTFIKRKVFRLSDILEVLEPSPDGPSVPYARFRLPDWVAGRNTSKMVCAVIDDTSIARKFTKGQMVCVDTGDIPASGTCGGSGWYVLKVHGKPFVCIGEKEGHTLRFKDVVGSASRTPLTVDLRFDQKPIVGRVVCVFFML